MATYTLRYETDDKITGGTKTVQHETSNVRAIEILGRSLVRRSEREEVWNIAVLDADGDDVTFDFSCFQN